MRTRFPASVLGLTLVIASLASTVATAPGARGGTRALGIDVSKYQQPPYGTAPVDWTAAAADGVEFAIIKATEGKKSVDPAFATNAAGAVAAGITIGMYHVASPSTSADDARIEANHFVSVAEPGAGNIIPALDIEINRVPAGMTPAELEAWARVWLHRVTNRLGVRPMVYGSIYMFQTLLGNTTWFADNGYPLWLARWGALPSPLPANDWQGHGWTFWQYTNTGNVNGFTTDVDRDRYVGGDLTTATIASVTAQPGAGGSIVDGSGRLACPASTTCTVLYNPNEPVELTASPDPGYTFVSWSGGCAGTTPTCSLTALGEQTVTATFSYRLRVHVDGNGAGTVVSTPAGIDCPGTCSATFASGAGVTLTAGPDPWSAVVWSGDCSGSDPNGCAVTMDQPHEVNATFADLGPAIATVKPPGARNGPIRIRFGEAVHHVNGDNLVLRLKGGRQVDARLTCFGATGGRTPCATGAVRSAELQPTTALRKGRTYVAVVDPAGVAPIRDRAGKATPLVRVTFTV